MKFNTKEDLIAYYDNLYKNREGWLTDAMMITVNETRMYQREKANFIDFMFQQHEKFDNYNQYVVTKRNECKNLKNGDKIVFVSDRESEVFTKGKEYAVHRVEKGFGKDDIWFYSDIGKFGYIVEDDYIYEFELVKSE